jgi:hypothetical protein
VLAGYMVRRLLHLWWPETKERDGKGLLPNIPFKGTHPVIEL